jgi:cofilin
VEKTSTDPDYEMFLSNLPEGECRYAVCDVEYEAGGGGGKRSKVCFFTWYVVSTQPRYLLLNVHLWYRAPDDAKVRDKMVFASSKNSLYIQLVGISAEFQGSDIGELDYQRGTLPPLCVLLLVQLTLMPVTMKLKQGKGH